MTVLTSALTEGYAEIGTPEQIGALYAALSAAQGEFGEIHRSKTVTIQPRDSRAYSFSYAPLEDLHAATRPALVNHKLAVLTPVERAHHDGSARVLAILAHADGGRIVSSFAFAPNADMKLCAGQITYLRRYGYSALLNLAADDDDDDVSTEQHAASAPRAVAPPKQADQPKPPPSKAATSPPAESQISIEHDPAWRRWLVVVDEAKAAGITSIPDLQLPVPQAALFSAGQSLRLAIDMKLKESEPQPLPLDGGDNGVAAHATQDQYRAITSLHQSLGDAEWSLPVSFEEAAAVIQELNERASKSRASAGAPT